MSNELLSFCCPENLSLIFELFQYDELRHCPESIFLVEEKEFFCSWKVSKFLHAASNFSHK